jgi:hypothetical protein
MILLQICEYQHNVQQRTFGTTYINDTSSMAREEKVSLLPLIAHSFVEDAG